MNTIEILAEIESIRLKIATMPRGDSRISGLTIALIVLYDEYVNKTEGRKAA